MLSLFLLQEIYPIFFKHVFGLKMNAIEGVVKIALEKMLRQLVLIRIYSFIFCYFVGILDLNKLIKSDGKIFHSLYCIV